MKYTIFLLVVLLVIVISPLLTIWALNTLFPVLAIPYSIETWFATVMIGTFVKTNVTVRR